MAISAYSKRFQSILVMILLFCLPVNAETWPEPDDVDICAGEGVGMFYGSQGSAYYYIMPTVYISANGQRRYCGLGAMYWYKGKWTKYTGYTYFQWSSESGGKWYLQGSWSGNPTNYYSSCDNPPDYSQWLDGDYTPPDDTDLLGDWVNDQNHPFQDEDHDGIDDKYDNDCPMHDRFKAELCLENPEGCNAWDDPKNYEMWQNDHYAWLVNNRDGALYDYDGDGFSDGWENVHGYDPMDPASHPSGTKELDAGSGILTGDYDGSNLGNWQGRDSDGDGYTDGLEWEHGSDWNNADDDPGSEIPQDWYDQDFDGDGQDNQTDPDPIDSNIHSPGYSPGGYTGDGTGETNADAPGDDEVYEDPDQYEVGNYPTNPGNFNFGNEDYDNMLGRFNTIRGNWDNLRPDEQRDYRVLFNIPFPGGVRQFDVSLLPDTSTSMGQAVDKLRQWLRILFIALMTYWFIRNIWLVLRQY